MKRRFFLQSLFIFSGGLIMAGPGVLAQSKKVKRTISGTVQAQGKKLANVIVSDGSAVVTTNKRGRFKLPCNPKANFVFVSVPSGYAFPTENGVAKHYLPLIPDKDNHYDFDLVPLSKDDSQHSFIIWADPQVKNKQDVALMMQHSVPDVQKLVQNMGPDALVHGIGVGDLVWDNHRLFPQYNKAVAAMGIPFFQALGNHDMDYRQGGDETSDITFQKVFGPTYYSFNRGKAHYVVLDDVRYLGKEREYDGFITAQQLDWLKEDLKHVSKNKLIILCAHIPVARVKNNEELYSLLQGYQVHIMTGHTHTNYNTAREGIFEHVHGTVSGAWWTGPICTDGTPNGYGVYQVDGNQLKWYYKSTGHDPSHQLSIDVQQLTDQKRFIANVWNWDPAWKVEWYADGNYMGALENNKGFDPVAVRTMRGDQLPTRRPFAEPSRTEHLFTGHVKPEVKQIKVVATDRFGNKYESTAG
ncbi:calcineurin-like phosphoesterase C-terminal domain-containing protein [Rufibacter roseus]|uniref:Calcineurin-like phosphoesterase C-terminal domain-containing protein n=1 Tax=Rufibacter roseus TaxID=1567108 RepID=A0ABW2DLU4_9BACT|nr:calcineurin-like phosphoesterase family protein [Rufibacter roseus]